MHRGFRLSDVGQTFGKRNVLNRINLDIEPGHISAILGPNGAGKTTLLRIMALLAKPSSGKLTIFGENVTWNQSQLVRLRRQMSMVSQSAYMFEGDVFNNVAYGLQLRRLSKQEKQSRVEESLEMVNMRDFVSYPARRLSSGEKQKVALARSLVLNPKILFLDEPTSNIDSASAIDIEKYIKVIRDEYKSNVFMVTHNIFQARRISDQVFILWNGELIESADTAKIFSDPRDERTRAFISGDMYF